MSRYARTPITEEGAYELWVRPEFNRFLDVVYTVIEGDQLDLISYKVYGREDWYYAIAVANDILYPFDLKPGMQLKIPHPEDILRFEGEL